MALAGKVDVVICGAGAIGLSIARSAAMRGLEVLVLERAARSGAGITSRNSGVIHQGLYYPQTSLKNKFCLEGKHMLSEYLCDRAIPHKACGKLVVATDSKELDILKKLLAHARNVGVNELKEIAVGEVKAMEPDISCVGALWSPKTSVFDVPTYISSLESDCELAGVTFVFNCAMQSASRDDRNENFIVTTDQGNILCNSLVNCAGLTAPMVAASVKDYPKQLVPKMYFAKGNYFKLEGSKKPFKHLVYPIPNDSGLGIHATLDMEGHVRFGPDVEWLIGDSSAADDPYRAELFYKAIGSYFPTIRDFALVPDYCGIRPKLRSPMTPKGINTDFSIETNEVHGVFGLVNLFGIESPGLTASLSIGEFVADNILNHSLGAY